MRCDGHHISHYCPCLVTFVQAAGTCKTHINPPGYILPALNSAFRWFSGGRRVDQARESDRADGVEHAEESEGRVPRQLRPRRVRLGLQRVALPGRRHREFEITSWIFNPLILRVCIIRSEKENVIQEC